MRSAEPSTATLETRSLLKRTASLKHHQAKRVSQSFLVFHLVVSTREQLLLLAFLIIISNPIFWGEIVLFVACTNSAIQTTACVKHMIPVRLAVWFVLLGSTIFLHFNQKKQHLYSEPMGKTKNICSLCYILFASQTKGWNKICGLVRKMNWDFSRSRVQFILNL